MQRALGCTQTHMSSVPPSWSGRPAWTGASCGLVADAPDGSFELPADYLQQDMEDILTEAVGVEDDSGAGAATGGRAAKAGAAGESEPDIAY